MPSSNAPVQGSSQPEDPDPKTSVQPVVAMGISLAVAGAGGWLTDWDQAVVLFGSCLVFFTSFGRQNPPMR